MGNKFATVVFCCFFVLSSQIKAGIAGIYDFNARNNTHLTNLKPWNHMYGLGPSDLQYYLPLEGARSYTTVRGLTFTGRSSNPLFLRLSASFDDSKWIGGEFVAKTSFINDEFVIPAGKSVDTALISASFWVVSARLEIIELKPISSKGTFAINFGPGAGQTSTLFFTSNDFFNIYLNGVDNIPGYHVTFYSPTGDIPSGVTASSLETVIPTSVTSSFTLVYSATDSLISPEKVYTTVNYIYKPLDPENPPPSTNPKPPNLPPPGSTVTLPDGTVATVMNDSGDVMLPDGTIYGFKSKKNPFYNPVIDEKTPSTTTPKPTESTKTETTKPEYSGENAETGAIVGALGDVGQGFTESVNNLSSDVTNGLNGLGEGNSEGFNNVVKAISELNNDANINSQRERENTEKISESLEKIAESLVGNEGQEPDDVVISEETISSPSVTGFVSSVAGLNIAPASPPIFNLSLPRLGGLSPQLLTLDFSVIPFLHYFPLVRSILAWTLIIFTFKHIFQIFTLGS